MNKHERKDTVLQNIAIMICISIIIFISNAWSEELVSRKINPLANSDLIQLCKSQITINAVK